MTINNMINNKIFLFSYYIMQILSSSDLLRYKYMFIAEFGNYHILKIQIIIWVLDNLVLIIVMQSLFLFILRIIFLN